MNSCQELATETIERFSKNYGLTHDIAVIVTDRNGGVAVSSTADKETVFDAITKTAANGLLEAGVTGLRDFIAKFMKGGR